MRVAIKGIFAAAVIAIGASSAFAQGAKIFVVGGKPDDPFWSIVKRGAEDAGKVVAAEGGKVAWLALQNYYNLGVDAAELIRQAIDQHADAIVAPDCVPAAMDPAFQAVKKAGIPFVVYKAGGIQAADRLGAMNYVGAVDYKAGVAAGDYMGKAGHKNGVCVNSLLGVANIEDYCKGFADGIKNAGGKSDVLPLRRPRRATSPPSRRRFAPICCNMPTSTRRWRRRTSMPSASFSASRRPARRARRTCAPSTPIRRFWPRSPPARRIAPSISRDISRASTPCRS